MAIRARKHPLSKLRDQRGLFTVVETLIVAIIMVAVLGAVFMLFDVGVRERDRVEGRIRTLADQRIGFERLMRELRRASTIEFVTPEPPLPSPNSTGSIRAKLNLREAGGDSRLVTYGSDAEGNLSRSWEEVPGDDSTKRSKLLLSNVSSLVFTLDDIVQTTSVQVEVAVCEESPDGALCGKAGARNPLVLSDTVTPRNIRTISEADQCEEHPTDVGCE